MLTRMVGGVLVAGVLVASTVNLACVAEEAASENSTPQEAASIDMTPHIFERFEPIPEPPVGVEGEPSINLRYTR